MDELLLPGGRIYEQRNFIYQAIQDIPGLSAVKPKAGLYIFPKIDRNMYRIDDDEQFVLNFLKQEKVLLVHGRGFNWKDPDHFRIVYLPRVDELAQIQEKNDALLAPISPLISGCYKKAGKYSGLFLIYFTYFFSSMTVFKLQK